MGTCPCESSERNEPVSRVSGTNEVSDGNETNNPAEVSDGNETNNPAE
ncbi:acyl-CoA carboxylase subunit epsilon, partial [Mycobacterium tuberculosis]